MFCFFKNAWAHGRSHLESPQFRWPIKIFHFGSCYYVNRGVCPFIILFCRSLALLTCHWYMMNLRYRMSGGGYMIFIWKRGSGVFYSDVTINEYLNNTAKQFWRCKCSIHHKRITHNIVTYAPDDHMWCFIDLILVGIPKQSIFCILNA